MTNASLVNKLLDQMEGPWGRSPGTCYKYRQGYATLLGWCGDRTLTALSTHDLELFLGRRPAAPSTTAWEVAILRTLFTYLHEHLGVIGSNPAKRLVKPKVDNDNPKPVPDDLWRQVWAAPLFDDERVAMGLAYFCSLRRWEVTGLRVDQFLDVPAPFIQGVKRKGGKRQGIRWQSCISLYRERLPDLLGDPALFTEALARLRTRPANAWLLPWKDPGNGARGPFPGKRNATSFAPTGAFAHIDPGTFNDRLRSLCTRLGLTERAITPHMLRHSFGTNMCRAGVPVEVVSRLMGHTNVRITMRYVDVGADPLGDLLAQDDPAEELRAVRRW
jgi:integrase